jgi:AcrR family transcriptional regulator
MEGQATSRPLPRGPHNLTRDHVLASQRARMCDAMATAVAEKGYAGTTVGDVVAGAGVSRKTFYEHFRDKEECFLAAFDSGVEALLGAIVAAQPDEPGWLGMLRARVRAYLVTLASRPEFARTFLIEVFAAGPRALERRAEVHHRFSQLIADLYAETLREFPGLPSVPPPIWTAAVGALNEVTTLHVREGNAQRLPELEDTLVYIQASLFAGPSAARSLGIPQPGWHD